MIVIIKSDGTMTQPMMQAQAESYLGNVINNPGLTANLKQVLNDVTGGKGKSTQPQTFNANAILHASSGDGNTSVSIFFYRQGNNEYIVALGQHAGKIKGKEAYKLVHYGQDGTPALKKNATIILT